MLVNRKNIRIGVTELLLLAAAVSYAVGIRKWFPVCAAMGDSYMSCHWAGEVLKLASVILAVLAAVHILLPNPAVKLGLDIGLLGITALLLTVPGTAVKLCSKEGMSCGTAKSASVIFGCVLVLLILADLFVFGAALSASRHTRPAAERKDA